MRKFVKNFAVRISSLSHEEQQLILNGLAGVSDAHKVRELIEEEQEVQRKCPHCYSIQVYKHGNANGLQRYRCRQCKRTYNGLTRTPLANLRYKEKWLKHIQLMNDSTVLRKTAAELGISLDTAFHWRHKFCEWMRAEQEPHLSGIIEADQTYFRQSSKGDRHLNRPIKKRGTANDQSDPTTEQVCVFTARDRANNSLESMAGTGPVSEAWLLENLASHVANDSVLVSSGQSSYRTMTKEIGINQVIVKNQPTKPFKSAFHIEHVTAYHVRLKNRINRHFKGVATKYLAHYLNWQHVLEDKEFIQPDQILYRTVQAIPQSP